MTRRLIVLATLGLSLGPGCLSPTWEARLAGPSDAGPAHPGDGGGGCAPACDGAVRRGDGCGAPSAGLRRNPLRPPKPHAAPARSGCSATRRAGALGSPRSARSAAPAAAAGLASAASVGWRAARAWALRPARGIVECGPGAICGGALRAECRRPARLQRRVRRCVWPAPAACAGRECGGGRVLAPPAARSAPPTRSAARRGGAVSACSCAGKECGERRASRRLSWGDLLDPAPSASWGTAWRRPASRRAAASSTAT
jgi:hypothetical protein